MRKLIASLQKEIQLLLHDKVGLLLMYLMPVVLVVIITVVQDSAFRIVNDNQIKILVSNQDEGTLGDSLTSILRRSGNFLIDEQNNLSQKKLQKKGLEKGMLASIYIPNNFSEAISNNNGIITQMILQEFGVIEVGQEPNDKISTKLIVYFDPVLQENFQHSMTSSIQTILGGLENQLMLQRLFEEMGYSEIPPHIAKKMTGERTPIIAKTASLQGKQKLTPNSTQHNVPAWSIFAMFFMVVSLGGNLVKERLSGSFIRLLTVPPSFSFTLISKFILYIIVGVSQLFLLFGIGAYIFPLIGLPVLEIPSAFLQLVVISILSAMAAVSYAIVIGTYARTQEQANGVGAISIVIFAAIGGIWVPTFVMPEYMQNIAVISPLHWCLEGYYTLFLKNGDWNALLSSIIFLSLFTAICQLLTYIKLKLENYL